MDTSTKTGTDAAKAASKTVVQKTAETTGGLIGNKIADKTISLGKPNNKQKEKKMKQMKWKRFLFHQKKYSKLLMT